MIIIFQKFDQSLIHIEEYLKDYTKAREAYGRLVEYYPDSDLAESARLLLQHVGRNPEDWVDFQTDKIKLRN